MLKLTGVHREYAWGSTEAIQSLLGLPADGTTLAEVWYGAHPMGPSLVDAVTTDLEREISGAPVTMLGNRVLEQFGELPFLMKLLAPGKAVSLQVHPTPAVARAGFEREEQSALDLTAFTRTFKDRKHKPEMVLAVTRFSGLVGFRRAEDVRRAFGAFTSPLGRSLADSMSSAQAESMRRGLELALATSDRGQIDEFVAECTDRAGSDPAGALETVVELAEHYPGDVGLVASALLQRVRLEPGQAVFVPDGMPHAYMSGLAVEIMANSDNVLRAGLTHKHVDAPALLETVDFSAIATIGGGSPFGEHLTVFSPEVEEFALIVGTAPKRVTVDRAGPRIVLVTAGKVEISTSERTLVLNPGDAVFVPAAVGAVGFHGGAFVMGFVPQAG